MSEVRRESRGDARQSGHEGAAGRGRGMWSPQFFGRAAGMGVEEPWEAMWGVWCRIGLLGGLRMRVKRLYAVSQTS